ncbi:MAG: Ni/Fe-hydrogenase, b-type cytochrome subunit [Thermincolia bacterium]
MSRVMLHTPVVRVLHWVNMLAITFLTLTGLYIHSPLKYNLFSSMDTARQYHFIFMWILVCGVIYRVVYGVLRKDTDIVFKARDIKAFPSLLKYYLFIADSHPHHGKYNPGQKLVYTLWPILVAVQAITGLILYLPDTLMNAGQALGGISLMRLIHYLVTWIFICTVAVHVYLSFINGLTIVKSIFTGYLPAQHGHGSPEVQTLIGTATDSAS